MKKFNFVIVVTLICLAMFSCEAAVLIKGLEVRVNKVEQTLQKRGASTVEIKVERAFDEDLRLWGYKLIGIEKTFTEQIEKGGEG